MVQVPTQIETQRLLLRPPAAGDGVRINEAIKESFAELSQWMEWAKVLPTPAESETFAVDAAGRFQRREELPLLIFRRDDGQLLGATGLHGIDWDVPAFEVGYWCRTKAVGCGYVTEAVFGVAQLCFETLRCNRFEARMDDRNERSWRVAERLGLTFEGLLRHDSRANDGSVRDTRVYAALAFEELQNPAA